MNWTKADIEKELNAKCIERFSANLSEVTKYQAYEAICLFTREMLMRNRREYQAKLKKEEGKQVFYMSMEFLAGTSLRNNLFNLGVEKDFAQILNKNNIALDDLYALEPDAGLGNGGLGRLASCFLDSLTACDYPATGMSIRYEFGIFKQKIVDGWQMEFPDDWLQMGGVWIAPRKEESYEVRFGGKVSQKMEAGRLRIDHYDHDTVIAVPYDMLISGANSKAVNKLVLWSATSPNRLDMGAFSRGNYMKALEEQTMAEVLTKILYPADDHEDGKILRLKQQYLLVSASLQSILSKHVAKYGSLYNLADKVAIHINDTHPALCVPELMRLLLDTHGFDWDTAWKITNETLTYTNHTVMSEALERWNCDLFNSQLPRVFQIVCEINRRQVDHLNSVYPGDFGKINYMAIIGNNEVRMANLCLVACNTVNGVSRLHSDIIADTLFSDFYNLEPEKFTSVTNGIAYRRWLCQANPELTEVLTKRIGKDFIKDANKLEKLMKFYDDKEVLEELAAVKLQKKKQLAEYVAKTNGIRLDPNSIFDVQVKRLHEYKRQLLDVMHIIHLYNTIIANPNIEMHPRTFIFAAKASSGYFMAKQIIRLIVHVGNLVNNHPIVKDKIKVVFIEDYKVSLAEIIIPAADISEQISIAGKEASGTGNMKMMMNGAVTVGTLDGANVEIRECVGDENMFLFGMTTPEVEQRWRDGYDPHSIVNANHEIKACIDVLTSGVLGANFDEVAKSLLTNAYNGTPDAYMVLADFDAYKNAHIKIEETYRDKVKFGNMSLVNIAKSGFFSADRSVTEYSENIWHISPIK